MEMKSTKTFLKMVVLTTALAVSSSLTHAASPGAVVAKLNWDGFHTCKAQGDTGWTASVRGHLSDGGEGGRYFQVRNCFTTKEKCDVFIDRIHHKISSIELLRYAKCNPR